MIPKAAIEKAFASGWLQTPYTRHIERSGRDRGWTFRYFIPTRSGKDTFPSDSFLLDQEIALDLSFWQALEVETRAQCGEHERSGYCVNCDGKGYHSVHPAISTGEEFCRVILCGHSIKQFWDEILETSGNFS